MLRRQIESGELRPGERVPSFAEMKRQHGVSQTTMEKMHALLEEQGLVTREQGRGTFVAQPPAREKTGVLGAVIDARFYRHPYYARVMQGIHQVAQREGVEILLLHEKSLGKWARADGILLLSPLAGVSPEVPPTMPQVAILRSKSEAPQDLMPHIGSDDYQGIRDAMRHLLDLGHRRIAYLGANPVHAERSRAYRDALHQAGIAPQESWTRRLIHRNATAQRPYFYHSGRASLARWLHEGFGDLGCTALLAHNDETAIGAIEVLQEAKLSVPGDISVVGFDGTEAAEYFRPRLTTLQVPLEEIGVAGAEYLLRRIRGSDETIQNELYLPVRLQIGQTTAAHTERNSTGDNS